MEIRQGSGALFLLVAISITKFTFGREISDCYANNMNPYLKFATKTSYEFVYERPKFRDIGVPDCEPVQLWVLARHGTRNPGRNDIRSLHLLHDLRNQVIRNHEERKNGRLCFLDIENLKTWTFNITMAEADLLSKQGWSDMYFLAKRFRTKYSSLFQQGYSPNLFSFRHTDSERTRQSAQAFAEGLFGPSAGVFIPTPLQNDTVIKPYDNCTYWRRRVDHNLDTHRQPELFKMGQEMLNVVHNVSQRLGFLYDLSVETILNIYDMCRYDKAWHVTGRSAWCAAFSKDELLILEYLEDLEAYYTKGFGNELNLRLGCTPIKEMMERFDQLEDENLQRGYQPVGVFHFSHSKIITMTLARLGIANHGIPLRYDNYDQQKRRDWRMSDISPFAANLAVVFFKCSTGDYNRVMFFLNEKRVDYEGCEVGLCSWSFVRNKFSDIPEHCNLDWCHNGSSRLEYLLPVIIVILLNSFLNKIL